MTLDTAEDKGLFPDLKKELDFFDVRNIYTMVMNLSKIMQIQKLMKENRGSVYKTEQSVNTLKHLHFLWIYMYPVVHDE